MLGRRQNHSTPFLPSRRMPASKQGLPHDSLASCTIYSVLGFGTWQKAGAHRSMGHCEGPRLHLVLRLETGLNKTQGDPSTRDTKGQFSTPKVQLSVTVPRYIILGRNLPCFPRLCLAARNQGEVVIAKAMGRAHTYTHLP